MNIEYCIFNEIGCIGAVLFACYVCWLFEEAVFWNFVGNASWDRNALWPLID